MNWRMHRFSVHIYGSISIGSFQYVKRIIVAIISFERIIHQTFIGKNLSHLRILMIKSDSRINPIWVIHRNPYISFQLYGSIRTFQPLVPGFYWAVYSLKNLASYYNRSQTTTRHDQLLSCYHRYISDVHMNVTIPHFVDVESRRTVKTKVMPCFICRAKTLEITDARQS